MKRLIKKDNDNAFFKDSVVLIYFSVLSGKISQKSSNLCFSNIINIFLRERFHKCSVLTSI